LNHTTILSARLYIFQCLRQLSGDAQATQPRDGDRVSESFRLKKSRPTDQSRNTCYQIRKHCWFVFVDFVWYTLRTQSERCEFERSIDNGKVDVVNNSYGHKNHKDFITVLVLVVLLDQWTLCECGFPHTSPRRSAFEMNKLIKAASRVGIDIGTSVKLPERANSRVEDFKQSGSGHLNLGDCGLDDNSVAAVLQVLKKADLLQSITKITLDSNAITKLPTDIGALEFVCDVSLQSNQLKSIPRTVLEKCRQMETLVLANNAITCMPEMEGTVRLNRLDVGNNRGFQLSATFATAMAPRRFALLMPSNMIQSFPTSVLLLHALRELDLHDNDLAVLPDSFSELPMLEVRRTWFGLMIVPSRIDVQTLDLSLNKIAELPPSLTHLKKLVTLKLRFGGCERGVYACVTGVQCMRACARCVCVCRCTHACDACVCARTVATSSPHCRCRCAVRCRRRCVR
jgi:hypothetical protein